VENQASKMIFQWRVFWGQFIFRACRRFWQARPLCAVGQSFGGEGIKLARTVRFKHWQEVCGLCCLGQRRGRSQGSPCIKGHL